MRGKLFCPLCREKVEITDVWSGFVGRRLVTIQCEKDGLTLTRVYRRGVIAASIVHNKVADQWRRLCYPDVFTREE